MQTERNMKEFFISVEFACDLDKATIEQNNIQVAPMEFTINGKQVLSSDDNFSSKNFAKLLRQGVDAKTTQINQFYATEHLEKLLKQGKDVLHISFSSAMSGTCNNFKLASEELNKKYPNKAIVVDSLCQSGGVAVLVKMLIDKINAGQIQNIEQAKDYCEKVKLNVCHYFTVDDMKFLAKSGRVKRATAFIGNLIQLKPVLRVDDTGTMVFEKKVFGRKKAIKDIAEYVKNHYIPLTRHIVIIEADCENDAKDLKALLLNSLDVDISIVPLNPVVATHGGPGSLAVFFTTEQR